MIQNVASTVAQNAVSTATQAIDPALKKAAEKFEAVFVRQVLGCIRLRTIDQRNACARLSQAKAASAADAACGAEDQRILSDQLHRKLDKQGIFKRV